MPFQVGGTKKGALPVVTEKRPRGKVVTVIRNIKGDKDELTKLLKTALGTGGHEIAHDTIEVQGDHAAKIQGLLLKHQASTGVATMKGVAGLNPKPRKPSNASATKSSEDETTRREARTTSQETLAAQKQRRAESRQRAIKEAIDAKVESTRHFHAFAAMMKRWRYWDHDYVRLHELHHRHLEELDEAARSGRARGVASVMDADADADADADGGGVRRSEVLDDVATRALAGTSAPRDQTAALRALGMIAEPSPFRQSREERLAESRRNVARARAAKASGGGGGGGGGPAPPVKPRAWDPALAALGRYADDDAFPSAAGEANASSTAPPMTRASTSTYTSARGSRRPATIGRAGRGAGRRASGVGAHGKGDPSRPTLGFTAARKRGGGHGDRADALDDEYDDDDASGDDDEDVEDDPEVQPFSPGFRAAAGGGFTFGPIVGAEEETTRDDDDDDDDADREDEEMREAMRLSLLESERPSRRRGASVGLHVECDDVWGDLTEEEAFALAIELSALEDDARAREEEWETWEGEGGEFRGEIEYGGEIEEVVDDDEEDADASDPLARLTRVCGGDSNSARALADVTTSMATAEEAAALLSDLTGCDASAALEIATAIRRSRVGLEEVEEKREEKRKEEEEEEGKNVALDSAGVMPDSMDEDAALEEALRLSALETGGGGGDDVLSWAGAQLATFTGEDDNAFLAEYLLAMDDAADVETFLVESFGDGAAREAKSFSRALKMQR
jgi:translation initiation factor 1 (eIF-1/SUI1)